MNFLQDSISLLSLYRVFTKWEYEQIRDITFRDIMIRNMQASWFQPHMLQADVFRWNADVDGENNSCAVSYETLSPEVFSARIEQCSAMRTFDYFVGSPGPYIGTLIALGLYLILNILLLVVGVQYYKRKNLQSQPKGTPKYGQGRDIWMKAGVFSTDSGLPMISQLVEVRSSTHIPSFTKHISHGKDDSVHFENFILAGCMSAALDNDKFCHCKGSGKIFIRGCIPARSLIIVCLVMY